MANSAEPGPARRLRGLYAITPQTRDTAALVHRAGVAGQHVLDLEPVGDLLQVHPDTLAQT